MKSLHLMLANSSPVVWDLLFDLRRFVFKTKPKNAQTTANPPQNTRSLRRPVALIALRGGGC